MNYSVSGISRRDFVNGVAASAGFAAAPLGFIRPALAQGAGDACGDQLRNDPRVLRSGNLPAVFEIAHWLRDERLSFNSTSVTLASGCDGRQGTFDIADDGEHLEVIIVGAGIAGLSAAYHLLHEHPKARLLLLEANDYAGGNAAHDEGSPLPVAASTAGAFCGVPSGSVARMFSEISVDWEKYIIRSPRVCFFFDEQAPGVKPGYRGWLNDEALFAPRNAEESPYGERTARDMIKTVQAWKQWANVAGGPDDPPDASDPKYDYLSELTLADYLTKVLHCDPSVLDFYTNYTIDCMGGTAHSVSAHTAISFLSTEYGEKCFAYPGGNSAIATRLARWLTNPDAAIKHQAVQLRLNAIALRIETEISDSNSAARVIYFKDGKFHRASGKAIIVATQSSSARRLVEHLVDADRKSAWNSFNTAPALVANVVVRDMAPFAALKLGYLNYWWGSRYWSNFEIADWTTENRNNPHRPSVLTFYGGITVPPEQFTAERMKLLQTPFAAYEDSLRADLARVMRGTEFDFDRDVSAIFVYRWGHSMILPTTTSLFGNTHDSAGRLERAKAPRRIACRPLGPISFAGQYTEGAPSVESAVGSGRRAAREALERI